MSVFEPASFTGRIPLFPLPDVVLFPNTLLPLHIYEPRYREMTARALEGQRLIGMALLKDGWESAYDGNPDVHDIVGVGKIIQDQKLDDGRYHILLYGVARARVVEVLSETPFRTVRAELLREKEASVEEKRLEALRNAFKKMGPGIPEEAVKSIEEMPLGPLCDVVASCLHVDAGSKQELLEELDIAARCERVISILQAAKATRPARGRPWPPAPSAN